MGTSWYLPYGDKVTFDKIKTREAIKSCRRNPINVARVFNGLMRMMVMSETLWITHREGTFG